MSYQSPISIHSKDSIYIHQCMNVKGHNHCAVYDPSAKIFTITDRVYLTLDYDIYQWIEYHFHVSAEHIIDGVQKPAELHYVFQKCQEDMSLCGTRCRDICSCCQDLSNTDILVIGRIIDDSETKVDLSNIQVKLPRKFYEYDGTLTTGSFSPVRWIIGKRPLDISIAEIVPIAKTARPIQPSDNRLLLYCHLG